MKRKPRIERQCETCGAPILLTQSQIENGKGRFCSARCLGISNAVRMNAVHQRSAEWRKKLSEANHPKGSDHPQYVPGVPFVCKHCGKTFHRKPWQTRTKGATNTFCSGDCRSAFRHMHQSGKNSPFWSGGVHRKRGSMWHLARNAVIQAQFGCCASCGKQIGDSLAVHHIVPFRECANAAEANAIENLIGLCQPCHMRLEWRNGKEPVTARSQRKILTCRILQTACRERAKQRRL